VAPWVLPIKISCHVILPLSNLILLLLLSHKCRGREIWPFKLGHVFLACLLCLALFVIFGLWIDTTAHSNAILIKGEDGKSAIKGQKHGLFVVWSAHPKPPISLVQNFLNLYCI
jgi:choline-glycine betaine transporter